MGYKAFMLAIQNQISVLTKILATKIQHQQILEHQQAVTAKLSRVGSPASRKASSNDLIGQGGATAKERLLVSAGNAMATAEGASVGKTCDNTTTVNDNHLSAAAETSNCAIS